VELEELLRRQAGMISRAQLLSCGLSARTIARRVSSGGWRAVFPGVYLVAGHRYGDEARVWAAWLWGGPTSVVSGPTAAWCYGMLAEPGPVLHLAVPRTLHRRPRPGLALHRVELDPADRTRWRDIALTGRGRTVLDTAVLLPDGATFLDRALQCSVRFPQLTAAHARMAGCTGAPTAKRLLDAAANGTRAESERILVRLLREAGIDGWATAVPFQRWELDLAFPGVRLAVELDGWAFHSDVARFGNDRRKGNALVTAGWTLLLFTWHDLTRRPAQVIAEIRAALSRCA